MNRFSIRFRLCTLLFGFAGLSVAVGVIAVRAGMLRRRASAIRYLLDEKKGMPSYIRMPLLPSPNRDVGLRPSATDLREDWLSQSWWFPRRISSISLFEASDETIEFVAQVPELETLDAIGRGRRSNHCAKHLARLKRLRALAISTEGLSPSAIQQFLPAMQQLEVLWISGESVTDDSLTPVPSLPCLRELALINTSATGKTVESLPCLTKLWIIRDSNTSVTDEALDRYRIRCPRTIVLTQGPVADSEVGPKPTFTVPK